MQALLGIALTVIGVYLVVEPGVGAVSSVWVLGVVAIAHGISQIMVGFQMRRLHETVEPLPAALPA